MRRRVGAGVLALALCLTLGIGRVNAAKPDDPNCWGVVTADAAGPELGQHAADPEGDGLGNTGARLGLANLARSLLGEGATIQDLGAAVGDCEG